MCRTTITRGGRSVRSTLCLRILLTEAGILGLVASFGFDVGSGLVSGAYPAWKAATLDPVQALRG